MKKVVPMCFHFHVLHASLSNKVFLPAAIADRSSNTPQKDLNCKFKGQEVLRQKIL